MSAIAVPPPTTMTIEDLLALPDDGVVRELFHGKLWERPLTKRNPRHSWTEARLSHLLWSWVDQQPAPRGVVLDGEAGFLLRRNPDCAVGIDVAYISAELANATPENARLVEGVPDLAVEILSPSDKQDEILEKVRLYLEVGVKLVWIVEPVFQTVTVYRFGIAPQMFNTKDVLSGDPDLPGLKIALENLFRR